MKDVTVHAMKVHRESREIAPLLLNLGSRWRRILSFKYRPLLPWKEPRVPIHNEDEWDLQPV